MGQRIHRANLHDLQPDFQRFFIGLELDNSKRYFDANRTLYEKAVKAPMVALVSSLEDEFGPGRVFRINRDIRFSKDKSPYKTNIAAYTTSGSNGGYVSLDARGLMVASGRYEVTPEQLARYRERVAAARELDPRAPVWPRIPDGP